MSLLSQAVRSIGFQTRHKYSSLSTHTLIKRWQSQNVGEKIESPIIVSVNEYKTADIAENNVIRPHINDLQEFLRPPCTKGVSISNGCSNNCGYCFVRHKAEEYGLHSNDWKTMKSLRLKSILAKADNIKNEIIQFPTTHDITPNNINECLSVIHKLLENNQVVVVTKPFESCIDKITQVFNDKKSHLQFRLSITSNDNEILTKWEPGAPKYDERVRCLKKLYTNGWTVGLSIAPMLDVGNVVSMYKELEPYCNDKIYVAKMAQCDKIKPNYKLKPKDIQQVKNDCDNLQLLQQVHDELKKSPLFSPKFCANGWKIGRESGI
eukprot:95545_1